MNPQEAVNQERSEKRLLLIAAIIPVCVMGLLFFSNSNKTFVFNDNDELKLSAQKGEALSKNLHIWQDLSWGEKEQAIFIYMTYLRKERNCAILKSPQHYVVLINRLLQQEPSVKEKDLLTVLISLAVIDYDFINGVNADAQAMKMLGPKMFEENKKIKKTENERIAETH
jgi:hypothetical protein